MKLYWNRFFNKYTVSLLIIIIGIFCAYYFKNVLEGLSPEQNVATSSEKCGEFTTANKLLTHAIANTSSDTILNSITSQIAACENLIDEINQYLPLSINDIKIGSVTQSALGNTAPSITMYRALMQALMQIHRINILNRGLLLDRVLAPVRFRVHLRFLVQVRLQLRP